MGQRCGVRVWFFLALGTARGDEQDTHVCGPLSFEVDGVVHELTATRMEAPHAAAAFARRMGPAFFGGGCAAVAGAEEGVGDPNPRDAISS